MQLKLAFGGVTLVRPALNAALPYILLGRRDFFAQYRVCFDQRALAMDIEAFPSKPLRARSRRA